MRGRMIRVKPAYYNSAVWVGELASSVSNSVLHQAFSQFGEVERATVTCDEKGISRGYGIVEFSKKTHAVLAMKACQDRSFVLTRGGRPVRVEMCRPIEDDIGLEDHNMKRGPQTEMELSEGPHWTQQGTVQHLFSQRWKELYEDEMKAKIAFKEELNARRLFLMQEQHAVQHQEEERMRREEMIEQERRMREAAAFEARERDLERRAAEEAFQYRQHQEQRLREDRAMLHRERGIPNRAAYAGGAPVGGGFAPVRGGARDAYYEEPPPYVPAEPRQAAWGPPSREPGYPPSRGQQMPSRSRRYEPY